MGFSSWSASWYLVVVAGVLAVGAGVAAAQADAGPADPIDSLAAEEDTASPQELLGRAEEQLRAMADGKTRVATLLSRAHEEGDVIKVLCLDDKLNQVDTAISTARVRQSALKHAVELQEVQRVKHESAILKVLDERVSAIVAESDQCVGEEAGLVGENVLNLEIEPGMPPEDGRLFPREDVVLQPPPLSSPTK